MVEPIAKKADAPAAGVMRPSVIQLAIRDKAALAAAYMNFVTGGGLFVPTTRAAQLGDDVYIMLSLLDDPAKIPVPGKVCWLTPAGVPGRQQGIGIQFARNEAGEQARNRVESALGTAQQQIKTSHTI